MKILDMVNHFLSAHPHLLTHIEHALLIKLWLLFGFLVYFILCSYREKRKRTKQQPELSVKEGRFHA
ncbi:MAG: hypothetical protein ACU837_07105 [Gammaproteobacteria bacterium]